MSRAMHTAVAVDYPCADRQPMAESGNWLRAMPYPIAVLCTHYRDRAREAR